MKGFKWLTLTFLLLFVLGAAIACGSDGPEGISQDASIFAGTKWEGVDYSGTVLRISISVDQNMGNSTPTSARYVRGTDSASSDEVVNVVNNRNHMVSQGLGIAVQYLEAHTQYNEVQQYIEELVMAANDETPDIFVNDMYGGMRAAMSGSLYNVLDTDEKNYFELTEANGWYVDFMDGLTLNPAIKYFLAGDYFIDVLRSSHILFVNIDRYEEIIGDIEANLYQDVKDGKWTYDYMAELMETAWEPGDGNTGSAKADDELIGYACSSICVYPYFFGSDHSLYQKDTQGNYSVAYDHTTYFSFAKDVFDLLTNQAVFRTVGTGTAEARVSTYFVRGNVLLASGMQIADLEMPEIRGIEERKGVIVYPKQNSGTSGYNTYVHDLAEGGMIALSTEKFSACTAYLQCINEYSSESKKLYAEYAVMFKYNKDAATGDMIDIIYDSIGSPFEGLMVGVAYDLAGGNAQMAQGVRSPQRALTESVQAGNNTFTHTYQTSYNVYVAGLAALKAKFGMAN